MTHQELPPDLGISPEDWARTPQSVRELVLTLYPLIEQHPNLVADASQRIPPHDSAKLKEEMAQAIEEGYGLLSGEPEDAQEWFDELRRERHRDDERDADWFSS